MNSKPDRGPIRSLIVLWIVLTSFSCVSLDYSNLPRCEPLEDQAPLPDADCAQDLESVASRHKLNESSLQRSMARRIVSQGGVWI